MAAAALVGVVVALNLEAPARQARVLMVVMVVLSRGTTWAAVAVVPEKPGRMPRIMPTLVMVATESFPRLLGHRSRMAVEVAGPP